jgi:hypothetical protein
MLFTVADEALMALFINGLLVARAAAAGAAAHPPLP